MAMLTTLAGHRGTRRDTWIVSSVRPSAVLCLLHTAPSLSQVYLQEEERLERRERASLARSLACRSDEGWNRAAALGPCTDDTEEQEAAARVRARDVPSEVKGRPGNA